MRRRDAVDAVLSCPLVSSRKHMTHQAEQQRPRASIGLSVASCRSCVVTNSSSAHSVPKDEDLGDTYQGLALASNHIDQRLRCEDEIES